MIKKKFGYCAISLFVFSGGVAFAQSSVKISGTLDMGIYRGYDEDSHVGGISRSNIQFSGVEDLGGGLSTTFNLSARFSPDTGAMEDSKTFFSGESTVGLKGDFGHIRLGRAVTAMWANDWAFDPWYNYDSIASPAWWLWHGSSPADPNFSTAGASFARLNNGIFYDAPTWNGLTLHLSGGVEKQPGDVTRSLSAAITYANGPFTLMVSSERTPVDNRVDFLAAKYSFSSFTVMGAYDNENLSNGSKNRSMTLSAEHNMGAVTLKIGVGHQVDYDANFIGLGAVYSLSKRTNVYASLGNRGVNFWGSPESKSAFGIGVNHSF